MSMPQDWQIFFWGTLGSLAVELAFVLKCWQRPGRFPSRFTSWKYWILRLLFAAVSGAIAVAYQMNNPIVAIHIGVATPLILSAMTQATPKIESTQGGE